MDYIARHYHFTKPGDLILDPMAGGGVVSDVCLLFERKCQSFDIATRDNRPEIQYHHWDSQDNDWPITRKADLIFFDPPYYIKKEKAYSEKANEKVPSISSYSKERYEKFIESFLILAHKNTKETTRMAFLNADWRDFEPQKQAHSPQLAAGSFNPHPFQKRTPISQSQYLITTGFYLKQDGK